MPFSLVLPKTRTVRVRVPYSHCTGAARTQIVDSMDTNTLRDTQKILKKIFFLNFSDLFRLYSDFFLLIRYIYTSSFFKFRNKANFYSFLGASAGTGVPRITQKIGTQCGCEYGYKNYESFGSLLNSKLYKMA